MEFRLEIIISSGSTRLQVIYFQKTCIYHCYAQNVCTYHISLSKCCGNCSFLKVKYYNNCASILGTVESPGLLDELFELFDTKSDHYHS